MEVSVNKMLPAHIFRYGDKYFLFDITTTCSFEIDEPVYYTLQNYYLPNYCEDEADFLNQYNADEIENARIEIESLLEKGLLGKENTIEFSPKPNITSLTLHIIHACNMNCAYCYGGGGSYGSEKTIMSLDMAKKSIDFLIQASGEEKNLSLVFFGGEPLLNKELIVAAVLYAEEECRKKSKNIFFNFTTNGTLLSDDFMEFVKEHKIGTLISIDGDKNAQDKLRPLRDKKLSSYDTIAPKILNLNENVGRCYARSTVTRVNTDILQMIETFKSLRFKGFSMAVVETDDEELKLMSEDYESMKSQFKIIADQLLEDIKSKRENDFRINNILFPIAHLYHTKKSALPCGAGNGMLSVTPDGGFYPCQRFAENKNFSLGDIFSGIDFEKREAFLTPMVNNDEKCKKCWIRKICAGGCWYERLNNDETKILEAYPHEEKCDLSRYIYELSIAVYNEAMDEKEAVKHLVDEQADGSAKIGNTARL